VKGFGRGSKELGIPTANFTEEVVAGLPAEILSGVYYGLARLDDGDVHGMVMSVGWNPYYSNATRSMETHILHQFPADFYGAWLRVAVLGYIRPEANFSSLEALIAAIHSDIGVARQALQRPECVALAGHAFLRAPCQATAATAAQVPTATKAAAAQPTAAPTTTAATTTTATANATTTTATATTTTNAATTANATATNANTANATNTATATANGAASDKTES